MSTTNLSEILVISSDSRKNFQDQLNIAAKRGYHITHFSTATKDVVLEDNDGVDVNFQRVEHTAIMEKTSNP